MNERTRHCTSGAGVSALPRRISSQDTPDMATGGFVDRLTKRTMLGDDELCKTVRTDGSVLCFEPWKRYMSFQLILRSTRPRAVWEPFSSTECLHDFRPPCF